MQNQNNRQSSPANDRETGFTNKEHGAQGIDKVPGEEPSLNRENVMAQTQKGKNKVDGDPSEETDQPIENE